MNKYQNKRILRLEEEIEIEDTLTITAKIDTGADTSSIDINLFEEITKLINQKRKNKKPLSTKNFLTSKLKIIKNAHGTEKRKKVELKIKISGITFKKRFTLSNRENLKHKVLIGKNILKTNKFIIDPDL